MGDDPEFFCLRANRKNVTAAQRDFPEVPRLTNAQNELLDLLDVLLPDPRFCYSMQLDRGDLQLLNNYVVIHSRTNFEDHDDPKLKRHLLRLWLSLPQGQRLPPLWKEYFGDIEAGSVRGGVRGSNITDEFLSYEARQTKRRGLIPTSIPGIYATDSAQARLFATRGKRGRQANSQAQVTS